MDAAKLTALLAMLSVHAFAHRLGALATERRRALSSFAGGVAAAYVFLMVLPKLASQQAMLEAASSEWPLVAYLYHHAYLVGLGGFVAYYMLNTLTQPEDDATLRSTSGLLTVAGLVLYCALIGDLVGAQQSQPLPLALFAAALTLHLIGIDLAVYEGLPRSWRWLRVALAGALTAGWSVGFLDLVPPVAHAVLSAWLGGSVIIHVVLLELPEERRPRVFVAGIAAFTGLMKLTLVLTDTEGAV